jgi:hypothetical protein
MEKLINSNKLDTDLDKLIEDTKTTKTIQYKSQYKTVMCRHYANNRICPMDYRCNFAHGIHDLAQNYNYYNNRYFTMHTRDRDRSRSRSRDKNFYNSSYNRY